MEEVVFFLLSVAIASVLVGMGYYAMATIAWATEKQAAYVELRNAPITLVYTTDDPKALYVCIGGVTYVSGAQRIQIEENMTRDVIVEATVWYPTGAVNMMSDTTMTIGCTSGCNVVNGKGHGTIGGKGHGNTRGRGAIGNKGRGNARGHGRTRGVGTGGEYIVCQRGFKVYMLPSNITLILNDYMDNVMVTKSYSFEIYKLP